MFCWIVKIIVTPNPSGPVRVGYVYLPVPVSVTVPVPVVPVLRFSSETVETLSLRFLTIVECKPKKIKTS